MKVDSAVEGRVCTEFDNHTLEFLGDNPFPTYRLKDPEHGRIQGCVLIFSDEGIVIVGDLTPDRAWNGAVSSAYGYGLDWFVQKHGEDYLCEKFLHTKFITAQAQRRVRDLLEYMHKDCPGDMTVPMLEAHALDGDYPWVSDDPFGVDTAFYEWYFDTFGDADEIGSIGWGYDPDAVAVLCAIQRRFRELWTENSAEARG